VSFVLLLSLTHHHGDSAGSTAVRVLKSFVQTNFLSLNDQSLGFETLVPTLAEQFDDIVPPRARSCVLWLVGQYAPSTTAVTIPGINDWAADVLRRAVKSFLDEVCPPIDPLSQY
jgi:AP-3 complex subunit beta